MGAKVTVVNTATSFLTETTTSSEGAYYVPYLTPGNYRVTVSAAGFKEFVREGITLLSADVPRVDIALELGSLNDSVTVSASASLLNTENVVSAYVLPADVLTDTPGVMKRTVYLLQYMPGVVGVVGQAGFRIQGQAQNDIGFSPRRDHRQVALYRCCEPGGWGGPGQHGRHGRGQGAHHRRLRGIRPFGRRLHEDGLQIANKLTAWPLRIDTWMAASIATISRRPRCRRKPPY